MKRQNQADTGHRKANLLQAGVYSLAIHGYAAAACMAALRSPKVRQMIEGQHQTIAQLERIRQEHAPGGFDYWFHAASLGEFEQARPVIEALRRDNPQASVLLSFFSPSGYNVRRDWAGADAVVYLPFDTRRNVRAFLDACSPRCAVFVKYEFWYNYLDELRRRDIPTCIISAIFRPDQPFFKSWGGLWRSMLDCYDRLFVQDENSRQLLQKAGVASERITVAGDTRFDRVAEIRRAARMLPLIEEFVKDSPFTIVAGSSWPADEQLYIPWLKAHPAVRAIIAPHEFDHERLETLRTLLGSEHTVLYSELQQHPDLLSGDCSIRYLVIDCFGLLSSIYRYGSLALIGGGFGAGIHNINEAAVYGMPVVFGPNHSKFREAAGLISCGGGFSYNDHKSLVTVLDPLYTDPGALTMAGEAAGRYISENTGATERILPYLSTIR